MLDTLVQMLHQKIQLLFTQVSFHKHLFPNPADTTQVDKISYRMHTYYNPYLSHHDRTWDRLYFFLQPAYSRFGCVGFVEGNRGTWVGPTINGRGRRYGLGSSAPVGPLEGLVGAVWDSCGSLATLWRLYSRAS